MIMKQILGFQFLLAPLFYFLLLAHGSTTTKDTSDCSLLEKCGLCIQTLGCLWCSDKDLKLDSRCVAANTSKGIDCAKREDPQGSLTRLTTGLGQDTSEVKNKESYRLNLRKGEKKNITIQYKDAGNRPLDLYILMDLSCSMETHKERVATLSQSLATNLRKHLTSNLRIGFGSFVDKPIAPFAFFEKPVPCDDKDKGPVVPPYGFKNHLELTHNESIFQGAVMSAKISRNVDSPEGTLEGIVQSVMCKDQIGWRSGQGVRKLLVVATDGNYHLAGDAKLLGVVIPHNGQCYVDSTTGLYTHDSILDYPSISVVRQSIRENDVFVIFAVTKDVQSNYVMLSEQLEPYAVTQGIDNEKSITSVIQEEYRKLVNTVTFVSDYFDSNYVAVKFYTKCPGEKNFKEGNNCTEIGSGNEITFQIEVELINCPSSPNPKDWHAVINVYPQSSKEDNTNIQLNMLCGCSCEHQDAAGPESAEPRKDNIKSAECSNYGHLQCGICECDKDRGGPTCSCKHDDGFDDGGIKCRSDKDCHNRGHCDICGKCICNAKDGNPKAYLGDNCECENPGCVPGNTNETLCEDGKGICVCNAGYEGIQGRCECSKNQKKCLDVNTNLPCNSRGKCTCEKCACDAPYKGTYCDIQYPEATDCEGILKETEGCVRCLVSLHNEHGQTLTEERRQQLCREDCYKEKIRFDFKKNVAGSLQDDELDTVCPGAAEDSKGCMIDFIIFGKLTNNNTILLAIESDETLRQDKCPTPAPLVEIGIGVASAMVLIGILLLLIWKVVTHIQDKKEYAQFEKSVQDAAWNMQNPLYIASTSEFTNPAFQQNETPT